MQKLIRYGFIGIVFPLLVQFVCYYQFTSNYTQGLFSEQGFTSFYNSNVYKSRPLGKQLHLWVYHQLSNWKKAQKLRANPYSVRRLEYLDPQSDPIFYLTYFFIAAFFTILASLVILLILDDPWWFTMEEQTRNLIACITVLFIGLTQFVVTPYDTPGYFFEAMGILFFLKFLKTGNKITYGLLLLTLIIATLNRETSLLILSFMAAIYFSTSGIKGGWILRMILPALCFLIPYLSLKLLISGGASFTDQSKIAQNFNLHDMYAIAGLLFSAFAIYFMYAINRNKPVLITSFLIFSLPYLVIIFYAGLIVEFRLWMPLMEAALILSFLNVGKIGKNWLTD